MTISNDDKVFVAELYHTHLTPIIFEYYARDMARRVCEEPVSSVLEVAAGTGVVTRCLMDMLDEGTSICATDLNPLMIEYAQSVQDSSNVSWGIADAAELPMNDEKYDAVVCQFSAMFFPDKAKAYAEAKRVLKPGGRFIFSVWDHLGENEFPDTVERAVGELFPDDPPNFLSRAPFGYFDVDQITDDIRDGGFDGELSVSTVDAMSSAPSAAFATHAFCNATPMRGEILKRDASMLDRAVQSVENAFSARFGKGEIQGKMQAHVFTAIA